MPYGPIPARLATVAARQPVVTAMWDGQCNGPSGNLHAARRRPAEPTPVDQPEPPMPELTRDWDGACERCGAPIPWDQKVSLGGGIWNIYDTPSGKLEPGCLFWTDYLDNDGRCFYGWTNCDGRHLHAVLPNGHHWDIDSRASNCGSPADDEHRCWVRHGEPPAVHVDKNGRTCSAGAGSIVGGDYHGFLHNGVFTAG